MSNTELRAILVCVDYADLLAVTLPWNRHHFDEVTVVTSRRDLETIKYVEWLMASDDGLHLHVTEAFYEGGAQFNKWKALEEGLDPMGRTGWICLMDADVLWPKLAPLTLEPGHLYGPLRRMLPLTDPPKLWPHTRTPPTWELRGIPALLPFPPENEWWQHRVHRNIGEWAGYTQIFHASDPVLGSPPWHQINWRHAGGADSFFQEKWPLLKRRRPNWEVLHLGEAGQNWMGRSTPFLSGQSPPEAESRRMAMNAMWMARRGRQGPQKFDPEKL